MAACSAANVNRTTSQPTPRPPAKPYLNLMPLLLGTPSEFDEVFGPATASTPTDEPESMPGEWRDYKVPGAVPKNTAHGLTVRFYGGHAVSIQVDLDGSYADEIEAVSRIGIDLRQEISPPARAPIAVNWTWIKYGGFKFKKISALKFGDDDRFTTVNVELEK
jgi:hypothetical protein